jgi:hypothetical protein
MSSVTSLVTLDMLADAAGDEEMSLGKQQGPFKSPFTPKLAYQVEITDFEVQTSKNGWDMAVVSLGIVQGNGEIKNAGKRWIMLPVFSEEMQAKEDAEKLATLRSSWGDRFHRLLRGALPEQFNIFARTEGKGKAFKAFDAEGNQLDRKAQENRKKEVGKLTLGAAKLAVAGKFSLVGKRLYYVVTPNEKKPGETYDNWFSSEPVAYELASV